MDMPNSHSVASRRPTAFRRDTVATPVAAIADLVDVSTFGGPLPLVIQPRVDDVDLMAWTATHRQWIEERLHEHGGLLFRGFRAAESNLFAPFLQAIDLQRMDYHEGATPRTQVADRIYTSTEHPAGQKIALHNELSYVVTWPRRILFHCETPAAAGGETPIADVRRVLARLDPRIVDRLERVGWMLVRNFGYGVSLPWQKTFRTDDRQEVERYCERSSIDFEWRDDQTLRTRQVRPPTARHPITGEKIWFNHLAFWHITSLPPALYDAMLAAFEEDEVPYNTYYGDGSPVDATTMDAIREAYDAEERAFAWQRGDILMLDNMLVAHGRNPYSGSRRVLAAMGDPCSDRGV